MPSANTLHIAIIGSGSAAFAAAIKATEAGARVTMIEGADEIGGTCVNVGCVPSKILLRGAKTAWKQGHHPFAGIVRHTPAIDRRAMVAQQQAMVESLRHARYESILESHPTIRLRRGRARFETADTLRIETPDGREERLHADRILVATGARPALPDIPGLADIPFWTSTEALQAETLPPRLLVIGGGVVAVELAQAFLHLGSRVTLASRGGLLARSDRALGEALADCLRAEGMDVLTDTPPQAVRFTNGEFALATARGEVRGDRLLVATGRRPATDDLGLDRIGVQTDAQGAIVVDDHLRTSVAGVFAAGDCTNLPRFVYVAAAAGTRAAINMTGGDAALDLAVLPTVVFTDPQAASVGLSVAEAEARGIAVAHRRLLLENVPRALANLDTRGHIELVADATSSRLLGCRLLADQAGEVIQSAALAIRAGLTVDALADQFFPYLTMAEGLKLCAQTFRRDVSQLSCCAG